LAQLAPLARAPDRRPNWTARPHQNLIAYRVARELVVIVREAKIADAKLRDAGWCGDQSAQAALAAGLRLYALLTRLSRR
jgi:hypothetical protein